MKRLIDFLLSGCWHQWEIFDTQPVRSVKIRGESKRVNHSVVYKLQCKHCGNIKKVKIDHT